MLIVKYHILICYTDCTYTFPRMKKSIYYLIFAKFELARLTDNEEV